VLADDGLIWDHMNYECYSIQILRPQNPKTL
jgi:hypothetical protein